MSAPDHADLRSRLDRAARAAGEAGLSALLVTPGPDLRYLTGYEAKPLERLTCLIVHADGRVHLVVPALEHAAALASPVAALDLPILTWQETEDPYALVSTTLGRVDRVGLDNLMWAEKVLALRAAMPGTEQALAGAVLSELRMRKSPMEVDALRRAGTAIDSVHAAMGQWLRAGRTEREVARDIADAIIASGHERVDFVIVASGPNGASPHHDVSDRVIGEGEPIVVDIGGTMPDGYCSDCTRMYCIGEPPTEFTTYYEALERAQQAAVDQAGPGVTAESVDHAARTVLHDAGWGEYFVHRTGHGIGLQTHEEPYIVDGNRRILEPGMAFSIEPGVYLPGKHGARIEDIVVCTDDGVETVNRRPRTLTHL